MNLDQKLINNLIDPPENMAAQVQLWCDAAVEYLNAHFSDYKLAAFKSYLTSYIVDAIKRRLSRSDQMLLREQAGPFSATWSERSARGGFFLPEEIEEIRATLGAGGTRTYRTPAPTELTRLNRMTFRDYLDEEDSFL